MKRQEKKYWFYLWDYLWWQGERWQQVRPVSRINGSTLLFGYIFALIILPLIFLSIRLFPDTVMILVIVWCSVTLAGHSWVEWIYRRRGKAVLKHYAKRSSHPIVGIILFLLPIAMIMVWMWYFDRIQ